MVENANKNFGCIKVIGIFILLNILLVSGCDYVGKYKAEKFCESVDVGMKINDLLKSDKAKSRSHWQTKDETPIKYKFGFGGFMFSNNICVIEISDAKVINKYHEYYTLD